MNNSSSLLARSKALAAVRLTSSSAFPFPRRTSPSGAAREGRVTAGRTTDATGRDGRDETTGVEPTTVPTGPSAAFGATPVLQARDGLATVLTEASVVAQGPKVVTIGLTVAENANTAKEVDLSSCLFSHPRSPWVGEKHTPSENLELTHQRDELDA